MKKTKHVSNLSNSNSKVTKIFCLLLLIGLVIERNSPQVLSESVPVKADPITSFTLQGSDLESCGTLILMNDELWSFFESACLTDHQPETTSHLNFWQPTKLFFWENENAELRQFMVKQQH